MKDKLAEALDKTGTMIGVAAVVHELVKRDVVDEDDLVKNLTELFYDINALNGIISTMLKSRFVAIDEPFDD